MGADCPWAPECERRDRLHLGGHGEMIITTELPEPICDFCSQPGVKWTAYTTKAEITVIDPKSGRSSSMTSDDEWAVCDECVKLLRADDRDALGQRSHELDPYPHEHEKVLAQSHGPLSGTCFHRMLHDGLFWPGFTGRIEEVDPNEKMVNRYVKMDMQIGKLNLLITEARRKIELEED